VTAFTQSQLCISLSASGDADTWQFHFVKLSGGDENFDIATGGSGPGPIGVLQNDPRSGDVGSIAIAGRTKVYGDGSSTAIGIGDWVTAGSDGEAIVAAGSTVYGQALMASAGACVLIDIVLMPFHTATADNTP
jgi:hypothetical protein